MASQLDGESALCGFPVPGEQWALHSHIPHSRLRQGDKKGSPLYNPAGTQPLSSFSMPSVLQKLPEALPRVLGAWRLSLLPGCPLNHSAMSREPIGYLVGRESLARKQRLGGGILKEDTLPHTHRYQPWASWTVCLAMPVRGPGWSGT